MSSSLPPKDKESYEDRVARNKALIWIAMIVVVLVGSFLVRLLDRFLMSWLGL